MKNFHKMVTQWSDLPIILQRGPRLQLGNFWFIVSAPMHKCKYIFQHLRLSVWLSQKTMLSKLLFHKLHASQDILDDFCIDMYHIQMFMAGFPL